MEETPTARGPLQGALAQRGPTHSEALSKGTKKEEPVYFLSAPSSEIQGSWGSPVG